MPENYKNNLPLLLIIAIVIFGTIPALISLAKDGYGSGGALMVQLSTVSNKLTYNMLLPFDFNYKLRNK